MTALQKFIEQITPLIDRTKISDTMLHNLVEEHLEMEKEQIIDTYIEASENPALILDDAQEYYNQTYKPTK